MAAKPTTSQTDLAAEYDLSDNKSDPNLDSVESTKPAEAESEAADNVEVEREPERESPARDPETGLWVKSPKKRPQGHHPLILERAAKFGVTEEEANGMTLDELKMAISLSAAERRHVDRVQEPENDSPGIRTTQPAPEEDESLGFAEEEYEPGLVAALKEMRKEIKSLKQRLVRAEEREQIRVNETRNQMIDRVFTSSGVAALGDSDRNSLKPDSDEMRRRIAVLHVASSDNSRADDETKIKKAIKLLFPDAPAKRDTQRVEAEEVEDIDALLQRRRQEYMQGGLARPTSRDGQKAKGEKAAAAAVAKHLERDAAERNGDPSDYLPE